MEKLKQELFNDPTLEQQERRNAGAFAICATAIGGGVTRCVTNPGGVSDAFLDTGP